MSTLSFFRRLASDPTANTIVISAVAMVPLIGMVGGAVDASRYYMTTTRMQAACDAGALAARRAMDDGSFSTEDQAVGNNFFDQNYRDGQFGLEDKTRAYTADNEGVVTGTATGKLPTSLMHIFGYDEFDVSVSCSADINIANTDIMFVLDVTGSMNCPADGTVTCDNGNNFNTEFETGGENASRIQALRDAVMDFYDVVEGSTSPQAQVRYGFLPYSSNVNVGDDIIPWMSNTGAYQSRTWVETTTEVPGNGVEIGDWILDRQTYEYMPRNPSNFGGGIWISSFQWRNNDWNSNIANSSSQDKCLRMEGEEYLVGNELWRVTRAQYWLNVWNGYGASTKWRAACVGNIDKFRQADEDDVEEGETITVASWSYRERDDFDLSPFYSNGNVITDTGPGGTNVAHTWDGCIQEAETRNIANFSPVPNNAFDLNINLVPTTDDERWKPSLPGAVYYRHETDDAGDGVWDTGSWLFDPVETTEDLDSVTGAGASVCPTAARKLDAELTRGQALAYVNSLTALGATYHDFGMIWGGRYLSPRGIFSSENATAPNGDSIARHLVFMTDGQQATQRWVYGMYGIEFWDRRITDDGSGDQMAARHQARFQAACQAARNENISVWVIAFGVPLDQNLRDCATAGRAFQADNATDLADTFKDIAEQIADLRLTQ